MTNDVENFAKSSKAFLDFLNKISNAIGIVYEPTRIRRLANAEAEANKTRSVAAIENAVAVRDKLIEVGLDEHQAGGVLRRIHEEGFNQQNIESITALALSDLNDDAKPDEMDDDWIRHFFNHARVVGHKDMQTLWARILAGEANQPGSFSRRTLRFVASMEKQEAELFTAICSFVWKIDGFPFFCAFDSQQRGNRVLNGMLTSVLEQEEEIQAYLMFKHLTELGLLTHTRLNNQKYFRPSNGQNEGPLTFDYFGRCVEVNYTHDLRPEVKNKFASGLNLGQFDFTGIGEELFTICGAKPIDQYFDMSLKKIQECDNVSGIKSI